ncbi:MAG: hypothetical protein KAI47_21255, partial [Deltaproteobacteria bacterium]|nr:hypothetical protein [Deltaproteobacteria bacterium]
LATPKRPKVAAPRWRRHLDLRRATVSGHTLVQRLKDGTRIEFTLNTSLQTRAHKLLERFELPYAGLVAYDLRSGEVLALAGYSQRDPKLGPQRLCLTPWAPAASVYKLITTSGLLARGVPADTSVCYHGGAHGLRANHLREIPRIDTTCRTLSDAVAKSINPIMAKLAIRYLDRDLMLAWSERYGFNKAIPFEIPVVPSHAEIPTNRLERARTAAGFWHTEMSVLHGAVIAGVPASGGILRWPHIVRRVTLPGGRVVHPHHPSGRRIMPRSNARALGAMMARTTSPIGTGRRGFISRRGKPFLGDFHVAGKTGSLSRRNPPLSYSWFVGYAPVEKPKIAFAVLLGNPPRWRIKASAAARMFLADYIALTAKRRVTPQRRPAKRHHRRAKSHSPAPRHP